jgi:DNA invertase Pin-like site-specific DNA recombinase
VKVAIYARVSKSAGDPVSIDEQVRRCRAWAKEHGHRVEEIYRDDGVSGTTLDRPALAAMLYDARSTMFDNVVVYDLDRLARDLVVQETIIGELKNAGAELHSVTQPNLEGDDAYRVFARQIFGASAQLHKAIIVLRLRSGREAKKRRKGVCEGAAPYGFTKSGGIVLPQRDEQVGVDLIRRLRKKNPPTPLRAIIDELDRQGIRPRRGAKWHPATVQRIVERGNRPRS